MKNLFAIAATLLVAGVASAHLAVTTLDGDVYYFEDDAADALEHGYTIWKETNGKAGLQETASCDDRSAIGSGGQDEQGRDLCKDLSLPRPADTLKRTITAPELP